MSNLLKITTDDLMDMLHSVGLSYGGFDDAGSQVTVSGPVTDQNRELWKYLETGLLYKSHFQKYADPSMLVEDVPMFRDIGTQVIWTDESQINLDMYYKVKLTLQPGQPVPVAPIVNLESKDVLLDARLWRMPIDKLRRMCSSMKLATTGRRHALVRQLANAMK